MKCPCFSGKEYSDCCDPFHQGELPKTPLLLMRSRYSAYALNKPDYLIHTTHPENEQYEQDFSVWRRQISDFAKNTLFLGLDILDFSEENETGIVTFTAHLSQQGKDVSFTERSKFKRVDWKWLYIKGLNIPF